VGKKNREEKKKTKGNQVKRIEYIKIKFLKRGARGVRIFQV
jgi:hypothetical protein